MSSIANEADPSPEPPTPRASWDAGSLILIVDGACAAVAGAYLATGSIAVTLIAASVAVTIVGLIMLFTRR